MLIAGARSASATSTGTGQSKKRVVFGERRNLVATQLPVGLFEGPAQDKPAPPFSNARQRAAADHSPYGRLRHPENTARFSHIDKLLLVFRHWSESITCPVIQSILSRPAKRPHETAKTHRRAGLPLTSLTELGQSFCALQHFRGGSGQWPKHGDRRVFTASGRRSARSRLNSADLKNWIEVNLGRLLPRDEFRILASTSTISRTHG